MSTTEIIDPLDANVNDIDTSYPRIRAGLYDLKVSAATKEKSKAAKKSGGPEDMVKLVLETTGPAQRHGGGDEVPSGHKISHFIMTAEMPERQEGERTIRARTAEDIRKAVAAPCQSAGLNCSIREFINNPAVIQGKVLRTDVKVTNDDEYGEQNAVKSFIPLK